MNTIYVVKRSMSTYYKYPEYNKSIPFAVDIALPEERCSVTPENIEFVSELPSDLKGYIVKNGFKYKSYGDNVGELVHDIEKFGWDWKECDSSISSAVFNSIYGKQKKKEPRKNFIYKLIKYVKKCKSLRQ